MRKYYKYFILAIMVMISVATINVDAAIGYTYSHDGRPIYSSVGFSVTNDGIYTIISDSWVDPEGNRLPVQLFKSPEDLFIYTEEDEFGNKKDVIYVVDSASNNLFIFDENMNYQKRIDKFRIRPENFTEAEILPIKTSKMEYDTDGSVRLATSRSFSEYLRLDKAGMTISEFLAYEGEEEFYIQGNGLSGVYRAVRPVRDERGFIVKGEFQDVIYLPDKNNNQIIIIDAKTYEVVQVVTSPTDASFSGKVFNPVRVVTDGPGLMFVISEGVYEGIMQMTYDGKFSSYVGVNYVTLTFWQIFQRRFMTDEQLKGQLATLNTIFTSLTIDKEEFIYTTSRAINDTDDSTMIKRINPAGNDVLTRNGYDVPKGDLVYIRTGPDASVRGPSRFSAIAVNDYGVYTVADAKTGRLFTYDDEGNLLYISAGKGNELTNIDNPVAIRYQGENILVLDKGKQAVLKFQPTKIAQVINKATKYHYEGNLVEASREWNNVVALNPNYEYAYVGIGKSLLNEERYEEAMQYFQIGYNVRYYSRAYKLSRDQTIQKYFTPIISVVLVLAVGLYGLKFYKNYKFKKANPDGVGDDFE
ncbi:MAG: hypothetical protein WC006_01385 [Bacilli bacterium]|nr:hypothetical protein [Bacilli bacterium]